MSKLELSPDGYERITEKIQSIEDAAGKGMFDPDAAREYLREAYGGLRELRQTLDKVCLIVPETAGPAGSGAA
ncbi:MAG: hypothetical protein LBJ24_00860 [Treponema sp.]|jgi:hypothetical protein|nr:hypothetical protein [Treponema sp.]